MKLKKDRQTVEVANPTAARNLVAQGWEIADNKAATPKDEKGEAKK